MPFPENIEIGENEFILHFETNDASDAGRLGAVLSALEWEARLHFERPDPKVLEFRWARSGSLTTCLALLPHLATAANIAGVTSLAIVIYDRLKKKTKPALSRRVAELMEDDSVKFLEIAHRKPSSPTVVRKRFEREEIPAVIWLRNQRQTPADKKRVNVEPVRLIEPRQTNGVDAQAIRDPDLMAAIEDAELANGESENILSDIRRAAPSFYQTPKPDSAPPFLTIGTFDKIPDGGWLFNSAGSIFGVEFEEGVELPPTNLPVAATGRFSDDQAQIMIIIDWNDDFDIAEGNYSTRPGFQAAKLEELELFDAARTEIEKLGFPPGPNFEIEGVIRSSYTREGHILDADAGQRLYLAHSPRFDGQIPLRTPVSVSAVASRANPDVIFPINIIELGE